MSHPSVIPTFLLTASAAAAVLAFITMSPYDAFAQSGADRGVQPHSPLHRTENAPLGIPGIHVTPPRRNDPRTRLTSRHEIAAMDAIQSALDQTADGATFVWHHESGRLSAIIKPTTSFRNSSGNICRHIHLLLNTGAYSRKTEGVACRMLNQIWSLEG